jgi:multidrug transporter EmrE-like cation transporter
MITKSQYEYWLGYLGILLTVTFTVYGQIILKWQATKLDGLLERSQFIEYLARLLLNPWILSSLVAAFLAFLSWSIVMTKLPLSHAYPFTAISFVLVLVLSAIFLQERITMLKVIGSSLVILGLIVGSRG